MPFGSAERELVCAYVQQRVYAGGLEIVLQIQSHQHGRVQRQRMRRIGGADERACGPVHGEPGERELVHADVQQRVYDSQTYIIALITNYK